MAVATGLLTVSDGTEWKPAKTVSVALEDSQWHVAKSVKVSDGAGGWTLVWSPMVGSVTLSLTPAPVAAGQVFTVNAEIIGGLPPGATLLFRSGSQEKVVTPAAGATFVTAPDMVHGAPGTYEWFVDVTISGNTVTYGPVRQTIEVALGPPRLVLPGPTTQNQPWTLAATMASAVPAGTQVKFTATNTADPADALESEWLDWGSTWTQTDPYPVTRDVTVTVQTPAGQTRQDVGTLVIERLNYSVTVPDGGDLQAALDAAYVWFTLNRTLPVDFDDPASMATVLLEPGGTYPVGTTLRYRGGVRLVAVGATIKATVGKSTHLFSNSEHGGGGYDSPHTDWMIIGGTLDAQNYSGGISTSHTQRFRLEGVTFKNIGGRKHHLEINSSGGPVEPGVYNCQVINCTFLQETKSLSPPSLYPPRTNDEALQLDYSWPGAAPTVAGDGTVTNNVLIRGCTFTNGPRAIGGHTYNSVARGTHANVLIEDNTFNDLDPEVWGSGASSSVAEGAIRTYMWTRVVIRNNRFNRVFQPIMLYIPAGAKGSPYESTDLTVEGNTFTDCGGGARHCIYGNADNDSGKDFQRVLVRNNTLTGSWNSTGYFVGCDETDGILPGYPTGAAFVGNRFAPTNLTLAQQKAYNKYRGQNSTNKTGITTTGNTVSDGTTSNS